jgi:mono/diheme cytochrome c family protein
MAHSKTPEPTSSGEPGVFSYLAEYETPGAIIEACKAVRDAGYKKWDAYTPFPVHGIDPAMGIRPTILPWIVLGAGLTGMLGGLALELGLNAFDYPWIVSGKPLWSIPAFVPVAFETTILFAALTSFGACLVLNNLPDLYHPLFKKKRFAKATDNKFFISIESDDPLFDAQKTKTLLERTHPTNIETVEDDRKVNAAIPRPILFALLVATFVSFVPMARIAQARYTKTTTPPLNLVTNMDYQEKYKTQRGAPFFADKRTMRPPIPGTVAQDELALDDHLSRGVEAGTNDKFVADFPPQFQVTAAAMHRGQERFNIYCAPCHGQAGYGDGMVARRADELSEGTWVTPTSLHEPRLAKEPIGYFFNVISNGVRNMPGYASQIPEMDRWAIALYIRALQRSDSASVDDVPPAQRGSLR